MTRPRPFIYAALICALLGACSGDKKSEPPASTGVVVGISPLDTALDERVRAASVAATSETGVPLAFNESTSPGTPPTVSVGHDQPTGSFVEAPVRYWGAFTSFWSDRDQVDLDDPALVLYLPQEFQTALNQILGATAHATLVWLPAAQVAERAAADPSGVALLPVELADLRLRSLSVGGVDFLRGIGSGGRMVETLKIGWLREDLESLAKALQARLALPPPIVVRVAATGDIIPSRCVYDRHRRRNDFTAAFQPTGDFLRGADIAAGSLDASISDAGEATACEQTLNLLSPARSVEGLAFAGLDVVTVATNHVKDCGSTAVVCDRALLDTLTNLRNAGIAPVGGGENRAAARQPVIIERRGVRFAFLGYDDVAGSLLGAGENRPGTAAMESGTLAAEIAEAKRWADVVIVMAQWGAEYTSQPSSRQRALAREAVEAGAALVVGNHPHVVQATEWRDGAFIAYALGNFVFDQDWSLETQQGAVLEASFVGAKLVGVRLIPVRIIDMFQPNWASPAESHQILERMRAASAALLP